MNFVNFIKWTANKIYGKGINGRLSDIHPEAIISNSVIFKHKGIGVIIARMVRIGENVTIYPHVTLGGDGSGSRLVPTIEDNVIVYTHAAVFGGVTIGHNSIIGAYTVVFDDIPPNSIVIGIPGKVVKRLEA